MRSAMVFRNAKAPIVLRMDAGQWLMDRAYGKAFQAVDANQVMQEHSVQKVVHIVKWLPPDPNDHSNVIEPEP